jgi:hypothetical protein
MAQTMQTAMIHHGVRRPARGAGRTRRLVKRFIFEWPWIGDEVNNDDDDDMEREHVSIAKVAGEQRTPGEPMQKATSTLPGARRNREGDNYWNE